jgi:hypothetical protein
MPRLPYMQFYISDWIRDTACLSLPARGAWIAILCALWDSPDRGRLSMPYTAWGRLLGVSGRVAEAAIGELIERRVCDANLECNGDVTLVSRRMTRDEKARVYCAKRVSAYRKRHENEGCNAPCNAPVTAHMSEVRSQKSEEEKKEASPAKPPATPRPRFVKPTPTEATEYARSIGYTLDGQAFVDSYEAKGWLIGKTPMKDWRAAVRTWKSRDSQTGSPAPRKPAGPTPQDRRNAHYRAVRDIVAAGREARAATDAHGDWERWRAAALDKYRDNRAALKEALDILAGDCLSLVDAAK